MTDMTSTSSSLPAANGWWVYLLQGLAALLLGLMLLTAPAATLVAIVTFLGFYWLIGGVLSLVRMFADRSVPWYWSLLSGVVGVLAGIFVLRHPLLAAISVPTVLVIILGIEGLIIGVSDIAGGIKGGGIGLVLFGVINVVVGILLLSQPLLAAMALPLVLGVILLVQSAVLIGWAFRVKARK